MVAPWAGRPRPPQPASPLLGGGARGVSGAGDVVEMVDRVVDQVPREGLDGEVGSVAAAAGALPLTGGKRLEAGGDRLGRLVQFGGYRGPVTTGQAGSPRRAAG